MDLQGLATTAKALVAKGKGILAADESSGTIEKRLHAVNTPSTEDSRRAWRQLLFTAPGVASYISGVILYDETIRQKSTDGTPLVQVLTRQGIIPGIKVDAGTKPLAGSPKETITDGLDNLRKRLEDYRAIGARFTKWRAVITIGDHIPTPYAMHVNAHALARYAALAQEAGLVPMVEPEVLMDGNHNIERCFEVTEATLRTVFEELALQRVSLEGMILKPNMVIAGKKCAQQASATEIAEHTVRCFKNHVPAAVPGIVFLSGGQSEQDATANLSAMNALGKHPWELSFSYGRALQQSTLDAWRGKPANKEAAQRAYLHRCRMNSAARSGAYKPAMEKELVPA